MSAFPWFQTLVGNLVSGYDSYNSLLKQINALSDNPLKAKLQPFLPEEERRSRKLIKAETILANWLKEAPRLADEAPSELALLQKKREECRILRNEGSRVLKSGLSLLEKEGRMVNNPALRKSRAKEAAPRLIDIKL
jgi:hypothetical protein